MPYAAQSIFGSGAILIGVLLSGCTFVGPEHDPCWDDGAYITSPGAHGAPSGSMAYSGGPVVWMFECAPDIWALDQFRFALTLGSGERFWVEPEPGLVENRTPIPTYGYNLKNGLAGRIDHLGATEDIDFILGFYNWGHHWMEENPACAKISQTENGLRRAHCDVAFIAIWNGTDASMTTWNPLLEGTYMIEVYLRDAHDRQTTLYAKRLLTDGETIDWLICEEASRAHKPERRCDGTLSTAEVMTGHPWPDWEGNLRQRNS